MYNKIKLLFTAFVRVPVTVLRSLPAATLLNYRDFWTGVKKMGEQARFLELRNRARIIDINLSDLFGSTIDKVEVPYGTVNETTGKQNQAELFIVNVLARYRKARNIFEFGTFTGRSTYYFTQATPDTKVTTLDLPPGPGRTIPDVGAYFRGSDREDRITQLFVDSQSFDPAPYRQTMDLIFVDGDHSYAGVKNDTEKAFEMLAPGGVILWHDYGPSSDQGLAQFFVEFTQKRPLFHIKKTSLLLYVDGMDPLAFQADRDRSEGSQG